MPIRCVMCGAAQPDIEDQIRKKDERIAELENSIKEAKKAETKEEADNIFDAC